MRVYVSSLALTLVVAIAANVSLVSAMDYVAEGEEQETSTVCTGCNDPAACCDPCSRCCRCRGLVAGVEATFLQPNNTDAGISFANAGWGFNSYELADFEDWEGAPRIWVGFENDANGWGLRARYWELDAAARANVIGPNLEMVFAEAYTDVDTLDFELTRRLYRFSQRNWDWLGAIGVRHATIDRGELLDTIDVFGATSQTRSFLDFDGTGITVALEGRRPFGDRGLALAVNLRGSALWGDNEIGTINMIRESGATAIQLVAPAAEDITQYILELQVGVEWSRRIENLRGSVFAQCMLEYQYWDFDTNCGYAYAQTLNNTTVAGESFSPDVEFTGLAVAIGFIR